MGYTTEFDGHFEITPPLSNELKNQLNLFCEIRHGKLERQFGTNWCDWEFFNLDDGYTTMKWNGSEKSYSMVEWARYLWATFFTDHQVTGRIRARGESFDDVWTMVASGGTISKQNGWDRE